MKLLLLIAVLAALTMASPIEKKDDQYDWEKFKIKYKKNYTPKEEIERKALFDDRVEKIKEHNEQYARREVENRWVVNMFADMTLEEMMEITGFIIPESMRGNKHTSKFN